MIFLQNYSPHSGQCVTKISLQSDKRFSQETCLKFQHWLGTTRTTIIAPKNGFLILFKCCRYRIFSFFLSF